MPEKGEAESSLLSADLNLDISTPTTILHYNGTSGWKSEVTEEEVLCRYLLIFCRH